MVNVASAIHETTFNFLSAVYPYYFYFVEHPFLAIWEALNHVWIHLHNLLFLYYVIIGAISILLVWKTF